MACRRVCVCACVRKQAREGHRKKGARAARHRDIESGRATSLLPSSLAAGATNPRGRIDQPTRPPAHTRPTLPIPQGPTLTAKLLNASAVLAVKPAFNATRTKIQANQADVEAAVDQLRGGPPTAKGVITPTATDAALPIATLGAKCGAGVAKCMHGCCGPAGVCSLSSTACGPLCQAPYSAVVSPCASALPQPPPAASLPLVGTGAVCGEYAAACATGEFFVFSCSSSRKHAAHLCVASLSSHASFSHLLTPYLHRLL